MRGPPLKIEQIFFAFLDELGHFKHKIKSVTMTSDPPHPRKKSVTNVTLFFFFYFETFPKIIYNHLELRLENKKII